MSITTHYCKPSNIVVGKETFYEIDDVNGWIPAVKKTYANGDIMLVVCYGQGPSSYEGRNLIFLVKEYFYSVNLNQWTFVKTGKYKSGDKMYVDDTTYVYEIGGQPEIEPYEDDLSSPILDENGDETGIYNKKLKNGLTSEYTFYSEALGKNYIFPSIMAAMSARLG